MYTNGLTIHLGSSGGVVAGLAIVGGLVFILCASLTTALVVRQRWNAYKATSIPTLATKGLLEAIMQNPHNPPTKPHHGDKAPQPSHIPSPLCLEKGALQLTHTEEDTPHCSTQEEGDQNTVHNTYSSELPSIQQEDEEDNDPQLMYTYSNGDTSGTDRSAMPCYISAYNFQ